MGLQGSRWGLDLENDKGILRGIMGEVMGVL